uniref:Uncharacterized protein n=1 Tax=Opuntia streptacantha TaxID=393608 RepID=A0A7C9EQV7_OPUST
MKARASLLLQRTFLHCRLTATPSCLIPSTSMMKALIRICFLMFHQMGHSHRLNCFTQPLVLPLSWQVLEVALYTELFSTRARENYTWMGLPAIHVHKKSSSDAVQYFSNEHPPRTQMLILDVVDLGQCGLVPSPPLSFA